MHYPDQTIQSVNRLVTEPDASVAQPHVPRYLNADVIKRAQTANTISARTVTTLEGMARLKDAWTALEAETEANNTGFQNFDWCYAWACINCPPTSIKPHIIVVNHGHRVVSIWPLMMTCIGPFCVLRWMSDPFGQFGDVLTVQSGNTNEYLAVGWQEIIDNSDAASVRLRHVRKDAAIYELLQAKCEIAETPDIAPFLDLTQYPDVDAYDARYNRAQRKRRKRINKDLEKFGDIKFELLSEPGHLGGLVENILEEKNIWLRNRGHYSKALTDDRCAQFLKQVSSQPDSPLQLVTSVLTAGERAISYEIGLRYKGRHMCFITAHDNQLTDLSPGRLHMHLTQRQAITDGQSVFDLMVPGDPYKQSWSNGHVEVTDFHAALNTRGRIFTHGFLNTARPALRKIYHATPHNLRRRLVPIFAPVNGG